MGEKANETGGSRITGSRATAAEYNTFVFKETSFWLVALSMLCLKCLLVPTYHSTDFEVHRNWMAVTHGLAPERWYYDQTSEWTLDYPPFFAYFEYLLSAAAFRLVPSALLLQSEPVFSLELLYFQRFTVILTDLFYVASCRFCTNSLGCIFPMLRSSNIAGLSLALVANASLLMVDNIHFQYNGFLTSFLLFSLGFAFKRHMLLAAFFFCTLLNFKHIYLYYAPAYAVFYLGEYLFQRSLVSSFLRAVKLTLVMMTPFALSFGILVHSAGVDVIIQILHRLFPFQRGLTHAYWAPNLWACYNFIDLSLYHFLKVGKMLDSDAVAPQYTSGLVQEYSHSVLPNVSATVTLGAILTILLPMLTFLCRKRVAINKLGVLLTHSAFAFFLAGYHVHEKAIFMVTIPYTVLAFSDHRYMQSVVCLSLTANISLFPLFFTPFENLIKVTITALSHFFFQSIVGCTCPGSKKMSLFKRLYILTVIAMQLYSQVAHQMLFGRKYEFVPLMLTSVSTGFGVIFSFAEFLAISYLNLYRPSCSCTLKAQSKEL